MLDFFPIPISFIEWIVLSVTLLAFLFILFTYLRHYLPAIRYKDDFSEKNIPVSVVVCAKNEEENLDQNLPYILNQEYPDYEVVIVNDCSVDNTEMIIDKYYQLYPNKIRKVNIPESENYKHGKKMAVFIGIKHAKNEHLVFTDSDCRPSSNQWLKIMASHFTEEKEIVLGYGKYDIKEGLLNKLVRYDTLTIALQYFSSTLRGNPYMGVGRNLAYTKSLFFKNKGFANHYHLASGDDDLFVNETANFQNTAVCIHPDAFTVSEPPFILKHWLLQKARHFSTAPLYKPSHKFMLAWIFFSQVFYYIANISLLVLFPKFFVYILISFLLKYILQTILFYFSSKKLNEQKLYWHAFYLELLLIISYIYIALYKKIKRL